jgi:hypothetical protein
MSASATLETDPAPCRSARLRLNWGIIRKTLVRRAAIRVTRTLRWFCQRGRVERRAQSRECPVELLLCSLRGPRLPASWKLILTQSSCQGGRSSGGDSVLSHSGSRSDACGCQNRSACWRPTVLIRGAWLRLETKITSSEAVPSAKEAVGASDPPPPARAARPLPFCR